MSGASWVICMGDGGSFQVRRSEPGDFAFGGDGIANGEFATKREALECLVTAAEANITMYRGMRDRAKRALRRCQALPLSSHGEEKKGGGALSPKEQKGE